MNDTIHDSTFHFSLQLALGLLLLSIFSFSCNKTFDENDSEILARITNKHCPDPRICIWEIAINPQGRAIKISGETDLPEALAELRDSLENDGFIVKDKDVTLYPDTSLGPFRYAISKPTVLNIRSEPSFSSELATQSLMGWPLVLKYKKGDWYRVQTKDGYLGWANTAALQLMTANDFEDYLNENHVVYLGPESSILTSPDGKALQDITSGVVLTLQADKDNNYSKVLLANGLDGWIKSNYLTPFDTFHNRKTYDEEDILDLARSWMGKPYMWGGTSPRAMDCSGFTKMLYHHFGYELPRDASQQVALGDTVTTDADLPGVLPGDLIYFGKKGNGEQKDKVTHVALYLGNGRIIHASGQVQVQSLRPDDPEFAVERYRTFLVAKRMDPGKLRALTLKPE